MTGPRMMNLNPEQELSALLDTLAEELLRAFDHEVSGHPPEPADQSQEKADAVRRIVAAAEAASGVQPVSRYVAPEPFGHAARDRPD